MINVVKKKRSIYDETINKIKQLWKSNERVYVIKQLIEMFRNIRKIALKDWTIHDAMKTLIKAIDYRLNHSEREVQIESSFTNDDWAKIIVEKFISSRLIVSTSTMTIISSSLVRKEKKKNREITRKRKNHDMNRLSLILVSKATVKIAIIEMKKTCRWKSLPNQWFINHTERVSMNRLSVE